MSPSHYDFLDGVNFGKLEVALEREVEGDLFLQDIGQGFGFRPGSFDGAIRCVRDSPSPSYLPTHSAFFQKKTKKTAMYARAQYIRATVAPERRDLPPDLLPATPPHALLHNAALGPAQPLARRPAVLPDIGRPGAADHLYRAACRLRRRPRDRLPQLQKGAQGLSLLVRWRWWERRCTGAEGAPGGR